ncbi:MAG: methyltransferase type 12 [Proteobacteria bacterium]|nr:MAG: methyltransferase type 12 [Pseudomonadota bacterium]
MQCRICSNQENNTTYEAREMMLGIRDLHTYFQCGQCGCLQIADIPENIQEYYPSDDYYSYEKIKPETGLKKILVTLRDRYAATGRGFIGKLLQSKIPHDKLPRLQQAGVTTKSRILDVGCGAGHLLHSLKECGFDNVHGVDPFNTEDINYANGLTIEKKSIHEVVEQGWDLIMMNHSFEHVIDQHETLIQIKKLLAPNGVCMIRIPTVSSWAWEHYGVDWVQLDAPRHLFLHSKESMQFLADSIGFDLREIVYDSFAFQLWGSEQYLMDIPLNDERSYAVNPEKSIFSEQQIQEFANRSKTLNAQQQGDQAAFYLYNKTA